VANVSYLRQGAGQDRTPSRGVRGRLARFGRSGPRAYLIVAATVVVGLVVVAAIALGSSGASLTASSRALATVGLPLGGGKITSVQVTSGPHAARVPVQLRGRDIWPRGRIAAGERVDIEVVIKRPGLISWLTGSTERVRLSVTAPTTSLQNPYLTVASGSPLRLRFSQPVQRIAYGQAGALTRRYLAQPQSTVELPRPSAAGSEIVYAAARSWEKVPLTTISWFPAGAKSASVVASPAPGTQISPTTPITLTFSQPVDTALSGHMPPVSPNTSGTWQTLNSHTITFQPKGIGYGLGAKVTVPLPAGVQLVGSGGNSSVGTWTVPPGSTLRLQQLLSLLGYLPVSFSYSGGTGVALTPQAQENAAVHPPAGTFSWRYSNVPAALRSMWQPGTSGTMTRGAVMAFENDQGLTSDGVAGADVWKALIGAVVGGKRSTFGYTFVMVSEASPESLTVWHNGQSLFTVPVNTGIASAPTATGTYPVFEHVSSGTMSGTNPDGSHYSDPGIPWISYFNGGDALHGFTRAQFGFPQSLGCVEMTASDAGRVWPYTPIGTLVNVA
jgi:lipoprotein-anchoring transpeptidase ErfK/SrfK